jgi:hypothetical protein
MKLDGTKWSKETLKIINENLISGNDDLGLNLIYKRISKEGYVNEYKHSGWQHKDINEQHRITDTTAFSSKIILSKIGQSFVIYMHIKTNDNKNLWLGFAGNNGESKPYKTPGEYTRNNDVQTREVYYNINIYSLFKEGFPELNSRPVELIGIRLRGSDKDKEEIIFSYEISDN